MQVTAEKTKNERDYMFSELKQMQEMYDDLKQKFQDQSRLL